MSFNKGNCQHHWIIESHVGPISKGICKFCGDEKEFSNVPLDLQTYNNAPRSQGEMKARRQRAMRTQKAGKEL